jgi:hypothetical protein
MTYQMLPLDYESNLLEYTRKHGDCILRIWTAEDRSVDLIPNADILKLLDRQIDTKFRGTFGRQIQMPL